MVLLESFLEGVSVQNQQRRIVEQALRGEVADMREYVRRKQVEKLLPASEKAIRS
jgi:hypothetical protein